MAFKAVTGFSFNRQSIIDFMYIQQTDLANYIDNVQIIAFTDDFATGILNTTVLNNVMQMASDQCDALVSSIYSVPFATPPAKIKQAAIIFACEALYFRRLTPVESNPMKEQADYWRKQLMLVNAGQLSLDESFNRGFSPVGFSVTRTRADAGIF